MSVGQEPVEQRLEVGDGRGVHLHQEAVLAGDPVALADLGRAGGQVGDPWQLTGARADPHPGGDREADRRGVDVEEKPRITPASVSAVTRSRTLGGESPTLRASADVLIRGSSARTPRISRLTSSSSDFRFDGDAAALAFDRGTLSPPVLRSPMARYAGPSHDGAMTSRIISVPIDSADPAAAGRLLGRRAGLADPRDRLPGDPARAGRRRAESRQRGRRRARLPLGARAQDDEEPAAPRHRTGGRRPGGRARAAAGLGATPVDVGQGDGRTGTCWPIPRATSSACAASGCRRTNPDGQPPSRKPSSTSSRTTGR